MSSCTLPLRIQLLVLASAVLLPAGCNSTSEGRSPNVTATPAGGQRPGAPADRLTPFAPLEASEPAQRVAGIQLLVHSKEEGAERPIRKLLDDPKPEVRAAAVDGLRQLGGAQASERAAVRALVSDPAPAVRAQVVRYLAGHEGAAAAPTFRTLFQEDDDERVRALALVSLAALDESGADLDAVVQLHRAADTPAQLRAAVAQYLCQHAAKGGHDSTALLAPLLEDEVKGVRAQAARALGDAGDPRAAGALADAFRDETDPEVAAMLLLSHGRLGGRALDDSARRMLGRRGHWLVQSAAAKALGMREPLDPETRDALSRAMRAAHLDPRVQQAAASSLGAAGQAELLEEALSAEDGAVRRMAILAYPRTSPKALSLARGLASDPDPAVTWASLVVRGHLGDETAYPEIVEGLRESFVHAADALEVLLRATGGTPNHGLDYAAWKGWLERRQALGIEPRGRTTGS